MGDLGMGAAGRAILADSARCIVLVSRNVVTEVTTPAVTYVRGSTPRPLRSSGNAIFSKVPETTQINKCHAPHAPIAGVLSSPSQHPRSVAMTTLHQRNQDGKASSQSQAQQFAV